MRSGAQPAATRGPREWLVLARTILESLRPHQWLKNALVFVPLAAAHRLDEPVLLLSACLAFVSFSLCASAVYLMNDLHDVAYDRAHPHKRNRPIASGRLKPATATWMVPLLLAGAASVGATLGTMFLGALGLYLVIMVAYSRWLKRVTLLDAWILAAGYALRVISGGLAVNILPSARLLAFCIFLFFSLALLKRYAELVLLASRGDQATRGRGYLSEDRQPIMAVGVASGALSVLVLALYMIEGRVNQPYWRSQVIWLSCALLLHWLSCLWMAAHRGHMTDDPLVYAIKNRVSIIQIALLMLTAWFSL
jgi:4-hydroxybenzoate polyprenyltransferase